MNETDAEFSRIAKDALVRAEEAEAEVQAWHAAIDGFMVTNWIGVYDGTTNVRETLNRALEGALDQERDALKQEVERLKAREERILRVLEKVEAIMPLLGQVQSELQTLWVSRGTAAAGERETARQQALDESRFAPHFYDK